MKFFTAATMAAFFCASTEAMRGTSKIKRLIEKVNRGEESEHETMSAVAGMWDVAGFQDDDEGYGKVALKIRVNEPQMVHLTKEQQQARWFTVNNEESPLDNGAWRPTVSGFRFKSQDSEDQVTCKPGDGRSSDDSLILTYHCKRHDEEAPKTEEEMPRFAKISNTFWQPCTEAGVPYGWPSQWGDFNYKFYAISDDGFLGCKEITKDGYCIEDENTPGAALYAPFGYNDSPGNTPVAKFSFDVYKLSDLMKGSAFENKAPEAHAPAAAAPAAEEHEHEQHAPAEPAAPAAPAAEEHEHEQHAPAEPAEAAAAEHADEHEQGHSAAETSAMTKESTHDEEDELSAKKKLSSQDDEEVDQPPRNDAKSKESTPKVELKKMSDENERMEQPDEPVKHAEDEQTSERTALLEDDDDTATSVPSKDSAADKGDDADAQTPKAPVGFKASQLDDGDEDQDPADSLIQKNAFSRLSSRQKF